MKTISFDPSTKVVGYAVFDDKKLSKYGDISPVNFNIIREFLFHNHPDIIIIETQYLRYNTKTLISLVEVRVMIETLSKLIGAKIIKISPSVWQNKILELKGKGKIKRKERKQLSIKKAKEVFKISKDISDDAADAINIGLFFFNQEGDDK